MRPKAIAFAAHGDPGVLQLTNIDVPEPDPAQVRVAVRAAGVNPLDWKIRGGAMAATLPVTLPHVPGLEMAGTVEEVGDGVSSLAVGDEVFGPAPHAYATYVVAEADMLVRRPEGLHPQRAAALPVAAETAYRALEELGVTAGQTLLVHGAAGAVGNLATQFALARGARVIGTARGAGLERVRAHGAEAVEYGDGVAERVRAAAPDGVDAALDTSGADVLDLSAELTGDPARVLTLVDAPAAERHGVRFSGASGSGGGSGSASGAGASGSGAGSGSGPAVDRTADALAQALALYDGGTLDVPLHAAYPLSEAAEAHRTGEAGHLTGKLVLTME